MFNHFRKKKITQKSTPINPNVEEMLNNAMRIHRAQQTNIKPDPALAQAQTQENLIMVGSSTSAPIQVMSSASTSTSTASHEQLQVISGQAEHPQREASRGWISSSVSIGQDEAFNEVCKFLTENDAAMVGIYGMGGVGKTTLMKKVRKEFLEPSNFKVLSTVVSRTVNIDKIQEDLMRDLGLPFERDTNRCKRARDISTAIANCTKKLALLFDDIWEVLDLDEIANCLGAIDLNTSIFKVIFTTRLEDVCSQMQPDREIKIQPLEWDDSWALFAKNVGTKTLHSNNEILQLAKSVAKECGGLPLALTVIGRAMTCRYSRGAWEDALFTLRKSPSKFSGSDERLFSVLKLSYDNLQSDLEKECFLFCCLYPEDWRIDRRELVEFWIGGGILDLDGSYHDTCNRGYAIIDKLLAACLIELKMYFLAMHDIVCDMGLWIASESRFFVHDGRLKFRKDQLMNRWKEAHGIFVLKMDDLPEKPHCRNLSTLILDIRGPATQSLQNSLLQFMDKLRILKVGNFGFSDFPHDILGELIELRYLYFDCINLIKFPPDLGNLRKLLVLEIDYVRTLYSIPPAIGQLIELRRLVINGPISVNALPVELGMLSKLEELSIGCQYKGGFINIIPDQIFEGMGELRKLILNVRNVSILPDNFWNLTKLEHLCIKSIQSMPEANEDNTVDSSYIVQGLKGVSKTLRVLTMGNWPIFKWGDITSALEANSKLSELIVGFPLHEIVMGNSSTCFSKLNKLSIEECPKLEKLEVGGDALKCLRYLRIRYCATLKHITGLEHLQCLKNLSIECCPELKGEIIKPNDGSGTPPTMYFPRLESLYLYNLPQLTMICSDNVFFPCLSRLNVQECRKMKRFPRGLMNKERLLRGKIVGEKEWWEGLQWQDEDFKSCLLPLLCPA